MAIDEGLKQRVRAELGALDDIVEKPIVGGVGFLVRGNLVCGVMGGDLLVRVGADAHQGYLAEAGVRPMTMAGRSSRSFLLVDGTTISDADGLARWMAHALEFARTLPAR